MASINKLSYYEEALTRTLSSIRGIVFDKDGTLFDFHRTWLPAVHNAAEFASQGDGELSELLMTAGGLDLETGRFLPNSVIALGSPEELADFWIDLGSNISKNKLIAYLDDVFSRLGLEHAAPVTDLPRFFTFLKQQGLIVGIATNDSYSGAESTVQEFGLTELVDFIAGYDSGFGPKPGPGMTTAFCTHMGLHPEHVAVVGDSDHDMMMAKLAKAGLRVGVLTGAGTRESLSKTAHIVIQDITRLEDIILKARE
ncbi:HAD family hydrolase [Desulfonatronovibrio magnus]|uniref:HAD family hydrolase n=1 Tax=Desulfonatronovibrio magnus TaxID=698827 RepID=UPI0005EBD209|nr:HAD family hydrolase [Desulfonatronovibrio magnus]